MISKSYFLARVIMVSVMLILISCQSPQTTETKPVMIKGQPRFIIGNYHNPQNLEELRSLAENGFNLVRCSPNKTELDMVEKARLYAWLNTGSLIDFSNEAAKRQEELTELVNRFKDHPALAVWEVPDEILWNLAYPVLDRLFYGSKWTKMQQDSISDILSDKISATAKGLAQGYSHLRRLDPLHLIWMNHAPRNSAKHLSLFSEAADIVGCDIYPHKEGVTGHSDIKDHSLSAVGGYTDIMQNSAPGKPVWMVLQAFSWELLMDPIPEQLNPELFPSYKDSRFMAWNAILHGARGILYWGSYKVSSNSLFWQSIMGVTKEISALEKFLISDELKTRINILPIQFTSTIPTRVAHTLRKVNEDYLLVVLQEDVRQAVEVSGLDFLEGKILYELTTDKQYNVRDGKIRVGFGMEPHVLCTSREHEVNHESEFPLKWDLATNFPLNKIK